MKSKLICIIVTLLLVVPISNATLIYDYQVAGIHYSPGATVPVAWHAGNMVNISLYIHSSFWPLFNEDISGILLQGDAHFVNNPTIGPIDPLLTVGAIVPEPGPGNGEFLPIYLNLDPRQPVMLPDGWLVGFSVLFGQVPPAHLSLLNGMGEAIGQPLTLNNVPEPGTMALVGLGGMILRRQREIQNNVQHSTLNV